ncbi:MULTISPECIES: RluA family pseudouridine synthase [unclassified Mycoplasma]|uniref:RluA family pseudouridine synthase n=1 Tax=unclassified Mycoplasma TaxID=2683645 RepID=UPI00211C795A|nr:MULTISPECIES: RluA family pseudouridine synthase [unclassified Mycoplasma]UUM19976.1 RluA family pseudouridine synthase [Mycoplasma sp. 1578d]UUM24957.1 RluA family pseudouridine synthase [Mycoplasma sp. 3686d]
MIFLKVEYKERIDKYICDHTEISRNDIKELIQQRAVYVNQSNVIKPKYIVRPGQEIKIVKLLEKEIKLEPQKMDIDIVYEDEHLFVINKPSGLIVHPAPGHLNQTLVNGLLYHFKNNLSNANGLLRPGIVHRIDKDTSGLLIIAKNNQIHKLLSDHFKKHDISREYVAIIDGILEDRKLKLNLPIGRNVKNRQLMCVTNNNAKEAITHVEMLNTFYIDNMPKTLVKCTLETGRTHQIRVHLAYIKNPVYGDPLYGKKVDDFNQRLHAYKLSFIHPITKEKIVLYAKPPKEFDIADFDFNQLFS